MRPIINLHEFGQLPGPTQALELLAAPSPSIETLRALSMDLSDWNFNRQYRWRFDLAALLPPDLCDVLSRACTSLRDTGNESKLGGHDLDPLVRAIDSCRRTQPSYYQALVLLFSVQILGQLSPRLFKEPPQLADAVQKTYDRVVKQYIDQLSEKADWLSSSEQSIEDPLFARTCLELRDNLPNLDDHFALLVFPPAQDPVGENLRHLLRLLQDRTQRYSKRVYETLVEDIRRLTADLAGLDRTHLQEMLPSSRLRQFDLEVTEFLGILETSLDAETVQRAGETVVHLCRSTDPLEWNYQYLVFGAADNAHIPNSLVTACEVMSDFVNVHAFSGLEALLNRVSEQEPISALRAAVSGGTQGTFIRNRKALDGLEDILSLLEPTSSPLLLKALLDLWVPAYFAGLTGLAHDQAYGFMFPDNAVIRDLVTCFRDFRLDDARQFERSITLPGDRPVLVGHILNFGWSLCGNRQRKENIGQVRDLITRYYTRGPDTALQYLAQSPLQRLAMYIVNRARHAQLQIDSHFLPQGWNPIQWSAAHLERYYSDIGVLIDEDTLPIIHLQEPLSEVRHVEDPDESDPVWRKVRAHKWTGPIDVDYPMYLGMTGERDHYGDLIDARCEKLVSQIGTKGFSPPSLSHRLEKGWPSVMRDLQAARIILVYSERYPTVPALAKFLGYDEGKKEEGEQGEDVGGLRKLLTRLHITKVERQNPAASKVLGREDIGWIMKQRKNLQ